MGGVDDVLSTVRTDRAEGEEDGQVAHDTHESTHPIRDNSARARTTDACDFGLASVLQAASYSAFGVRTTWGWVQ